MAGPWDSRKSRQWRRRMVRFEKSRRTVAEFCRREGVSAPAFYQWRKRLAGPCAQGEGKAAGATGAFTPLRLVASASVAVRLPGGTELHVPTSDPQALRLVIAALARADARRAVSAREKQNPGT